MATIRVRRGASANMPTLADGELALQIDAKRLLIGNGGDNLPVAMGAELDALKPKIVSVLLTEAGWTGSTAPYTQTIPILGVLEDERKQLIQPVPTGLDREKYLNAGVMCISQEKEALTFLCRKMPTGNLSVYVAIQEVQ